MNTPPRRRADAARAGETPPGLHRRVWWFVRPVVEARTWATTGYLLLTLFTATLWWMVLVTGLAFGLASAVVWVGVLILAVLPFLWRAGARLERVLLGAALRVRIPSPYRPGPGGSLLARARTAIGDPATWKDLAYLLLLAPLGGLWSGITVTVWINTLQRVAAPLYYYALPGGHLPITYTGSGLQILWLDYYTLPGGQLPWFGWDTWTPAITVSTLPTALLVCLVGLVLTVPAAYLVRGMGYLHGLVARALLGPSHAEALAAQAATLRASRDRAVDAATAERHRIERALHDGAQQRLVSVAMNLGMARGKFDTDPDAARGLVEQAHAEAKQAIIEMRDLARGIHPAVLSDRGLDAALSDLARRCPVPVDITVDLAERPPTPVEETAYFVTAEALTNVAKHAHANRATVTIGHAGEALVVEVADDGAGGAAPRPAGGLAGLADRVAGAGGTLDITSPAGGPTTVRAELPCAW